MTFDYIKEQLLDQFSLVRTDVESLPSTSEINDSIVSEIEFVCNAYQAACQMERDAKAIKKICTDSFEATMDVGEVYDLNSFKISHSTTRRHSKELWDEYTLNPKSEVFELRQASDKLAKFLKENKAQFYGEPSSSIKITYKARLK